jgi:hypothetical protein
MNAIYYFLLYLQIGEEIITPTEGEENSRTD